MNAHIFAIMTKMFLYETVLLCTKGNNEQFTQRLCVELGDAVFGRV